MDEKLYAPFEVTISFRLTMFACPSSFRIFTSRSAVIGNPFSSCLVLIRFIATTSLFFLSLATKTLPYVPSPTLNFFSKASTSRKTTGAWILIRLSLRGFFVGPPLGAAASLRFGGGGGGLATVEEGRAGGGGGTCLLGGGGGGLDFGGGGGLLPGGGGGGGLFIVCAVAMVLMWSPAGAFTAGSELATILLIKFATVAFEF